MLIDFAGDFELLPGKKPIPIPQIVEWLGLLTGSIPVSKNVLEAALNKLGPDEYKVLIGVIEEERLGPLVYSFLKEQEVISIIPQNYREVLSEKFSQNQALFVRQVYALYQLDKAFNNHNISYRLLKGLAVATSYYHNPAARPVGDVDVWILPEKLEEAGQVLHKLGLEPYFSNYADPDLTSFGEHDFIPMGPDSLHVGVDLHWHLLNPWLGNPLRTLQPVPERELFAKCQSVNIAGHEYTTLDATATLFHLCLHARAGVDITPWYRLIDVNKIAASSSNSKPTIDWKELENLSISSNTQAIFWRTFRLIDQAFGSNYSLKLDWKPDFWHKFLIEKLLPFPAPYFLGKEKRFKNLRQIIGYFILLPDFKRMLKALFWIVWPPDEWFKVRYGLKTSRDKIKARALYLARIPLLIKRLKKPSV